MPDILLGDIGGTTSRFACVEPGKRPDRIVTIANDSVARAEEAVMQALDRLAVRPRAAILAIAGPVGGEEIFLTNRPWRFRLGDLGERMGVERIHALNDFEAVAHALPLLGDADLRPLGGGTMPASGVKVVLGPGTGLGVGALVPAGDRWHVVASEGGHSSFGPAHADEEAVFARLRESEGMTTAETILCGPGLPVLHRALHATAAQFTPEKIVADAQRGDPAAAATIALFVRLLGRFAGDIALTFKATGGVYIAGGVARCLGPLFDTDIFRTAFEAHPPYEKLLGDIATALVTVEQPGLLGCAALAPQIFATRD